MLNYINRHITYCGDEGCIKSVVGETEQHRSLSDRGVPN